MVTLNPLDFSSKPSEAETIPLPKEEVTPPVTKMYFVFFLLIRLGLCKVKRICNAGQINTVESHVNKAGLSEIF